MLADADGVIELGELGDGVTGDAGGRVTRDPLGDAVGSDELQPRTIAATVTTAANAARLTR